MSGNRSKSACGIKISAVRHLDLLQSTRVTDRQTDRQMDGRTDRITTPKTALAYARAVKSIEGLITCEVISYARLNNSGKIGNWPVV